MHAVRHSKIIGVLILLWGVFSISAQNETKKWYFGTGAGIDFMTSPPTLLTNGSMVVSEGCSSVADATGALLFYTDGITIWDKTHNIMANGTGLLGDLTPSQSSIILRKPGSSTLYYVFTVQGMFGWAGLNYSVVDITLASGNGSVTIKNAPIYNMPCSEKLTATKHCNGTDFWVVTHEYGSSNFRSYVLSATGVNTTAVVSNVGSTHLSVNTVGCMKISPNGKKLGAAMTNIGFEMFDFDASSGSVSNSFFLGSVLSPGNAAYGCDFSPDCSKFYGAVHGGGGPFGSAKVVQWNLCAGSNAAISASSFTLPGSNSTHKGGMQLAPDGKIYITRPTSNALSVITSPNALGAGCGFVDLGFSIAPKLANGSLPNFMGFYFLQYPNQTPFTYSTTSCSSVSFSAAATVSTTGCTNNGFTLTSTSWNFGDPLSGPANTSLLSNPTHIYTAPGVYTASCIYYYSCGGGTDTLSQLITILGPTLSVNSNSINCANLGSATVSASAGIGPYTYTWLPVVQNGSTAINLTPGSHTILVYDQGYNCTFTNSINFLPLIPLSGTIVATPSITCNGASTGTGQVVSLQGGSGNQSYLWYNGVQSYTTAYTNSLSAGFWSVNVTDALTGCQINQSFFITQPIALSPTLSISTPSSCAGASAILTATNSGGTPAYTYTFINGPISFSSTITESISGTHVYTVQSTDANNCASSATVALNVISNPNLIVPSVSICPTGLATFTATGATTYTWLPPAANGSVTGSAASPSANINFTDLPAANTQYTLIGSALGCTSTTTTSAFIYSSPTPIISSNSPKCEGSNAVIIVSGGTAAVWSGPNIFSSNNLSNTITPIGLSNAGVYSTTITSAVGCTASANSTFVVNPTPTLTAAGSTVCTTQTMSLFAIAVAGSSYQWVGNNNFNSLLQNPTLANPTLNRTGSYTVIVTAPTSCTNIAIAQASVTSPPSLSIALSSNSLCAQAFNGSPNTITLTSSGANTYTLYTPNLLGSSTPIAPSASLFATPPFASTLAAGIATLQGSNGVCTSTASFVFTVVPNPTVGVNSFTPVICAGKNFTYTSNGANSYVWSATSPNYTTYSNGGVAVAHPSINSVFSVYGSSLGCQSALVSSSITVYPLPTITLSALSSSICLYDKTNLSVTGTGTSFQWLPLTGLNAYTGSLVNCGTQVNQVYTVIASANNCTAAATTSIHVWPLPTAVITSTTNNVCLNDNIKLSGEGGVQFNWFGPGNIAVGGQSVSIHAWSPGVGGTYTLVVTDINSCKNATTTNISILALPAGSIKNFKEEVCVPYCATYNFEGFGSKTIQSTWVINSSTVTSNLFSTCFKEAGTYTLQGKLFDNSTSCKSEISYVVNVRPKPIADFLFLPRTPIENLDEVVFNNTSSGEGLLTYHWYFNDNKGFSSTNKNTSYLYSEPGDYRVVLVTKNNFNCADTILKIIHVEPDFALYVPNTFTPNDDNRNDVFLASVRSSKLFDLKIYDRWGAEIFHAKSPDDGWDGTFKGTACKQDTYTWVIELSTLGGERIVRTGTVLLMR